MTVDEVRRRLASYRPGTTAAALTNDDYGDSEHPAKPAAVLVGIVDRADEPHLLLTVRNPRMKRHAGQVAFPGGRLDPGETPIEAALREAEEEVALRRHQVEVIGELDSYRTGTDYIVTPVVGVLISDLNLEPHPPEVSEIFEVPLAHALNRANHREDEAEWKGIRRRYYTIDWSPQHVWGATAGIIVNLARTLDGLA